HRAAVRLVFRHLGARDGPETVEAIGSATLVDGLQPRQLALVGRHDDLAAPLPPDAMGVAELLHEPPALDAEAGLQRAGLVVDARMDDAAVVPGLMGAEPRLLVDDDEPRPRVRFPESQRGGEPDDAAANDGDVL